MGTRTALTGALVCAVLSSPAQPAMAVPVAGHNQLWVDLCQSTLRRVAANALYSDKSLAYASGLTMQTAPSLERTLGAVLLERAGVSELRYVRTGLREFVYSELGTALANTDAGLLLLTRLNDAVELLVDTGSSVPTAEVRPVLQRLESRGQFRLGPTVQPSLAGDAVAAHVYRLAHLPLPPSLVTLARKQLLALGQLRTVTVEEAVADIPGAELATTVFGGLRSTDELRGARSLRATILRAALTGTPSLGKLAALAEVGEIDGNLGWAHFENSRVTDIYVPFVAQRIGLFSVSELMAWSSLTHYGKVSGAEVRDALRSGFDGAVWWPLEAFGELDSTAQALRLIKLCDARVDTAALRRSVTSWTVAAGQAHQPIPVEDVLDLVELRSQLGLKMGNPVRALLLGTEHELLDPRSRLVRALSPYESLALTIRALKDDPSRPALVRKQVIAVVRSTRVSPSSMGPLSDAARIWGLRRLEARIEAQANETASSNLRNSEPAWAFAAIRACVSEPGRHAPAWVLGEARRQLDVGSIMSRQTFTAGDAELALQVASGACQYPLAA